MNTKAKEFWDNCKLEFAHNIIQGHLQDYTSLTKFWETNFLTRIDFKDTIVLDYGIGGGYLGKYLFDTRGIKKYIGIDISDRSLAKANEILQNYSEVQLYNTDYYYKDYSDTIDIFICQAVIQHFFSIDYLNIFLQKIEQISPKIVMLQIRYAKETAAKTTFKNEADVVRACHTNSEYILKYLPSYTLIYKGDIMRNNYQFLIFRRV